MNKKLNLFESKEKELAKEITKAKEEVNFKELIKEYSKVKSSAKKLNKKYQKTNDKELLVEIKELEELKKEYVAKFKQVNVFEKKLYFLKKKITSEIYSLDKKKNKLDYVVLTFEALNVKSENILSESYNKDLNNQISNFNDEIKELDKKITDGKEAKKPVVYFEYKKKELKRKISRLEKEVEKNSKANVEKLKLSIEENKVFIETKKEESEKISVKIDKLVKLIKHIDSKISFRDADEIDSNSSFFVENLNVWYGKKHALYDISISLPKNKVIAIIGPSGCGKSTFLRTLNRINDNIPNFTTKGKVYFNGEYDIFKLKSIRNRYDKLDISTLRTKVGMIFQQPNPFPMSIYKNVAYGPKIKGIKNKAFLNNLVEKSLIDSGLYEEVKDNLKTLGTSLSGGQQQRLCIARAIANEPEVLLMDEPTSALDPIASKKIEDLIIKLKEHYTIIMVTHSMQQAARISDKIAFFYQGRLIEFDDTKKIFSKPKMKETKDYIEGKFG